MWCGSVGAVAKKEVVALIQEMTRQESLDLLTRTHFFKLACAQGNQPYVVPCYFAYNNNSLYSFSTVGQKIDWMRANPLVCVEADEVVSPEEWVSVIVFGRYEELPDTPDPFSDSGLWGCCIPTFCVFGTSLSTCE